MSHRELESPLWGGGGPDAMQVKGAAKTPPGREHLSRAHYYPNTESNNYMRIDEVMPTAIGEECPILGMENLEYDGMGRSKKFAMNSASSTQA